MSSSKFSNSSLQYIGKSKNFNYLENETRERSGVKFGIKKKGITEHMGIFDLVVVKVVLGSLGADVSRKL